MYRCPTDLSQFDGVTDKTIIASQAAAKQAELFADFAIGERHTSNLSY
jgi:hypothetical protein